jgi:uncharacterized protein
MTKVSNGYVNNRILKLNVGFLLTSGPGHSHNSQVDFPAVRVADDLLLHYMRGPLRLSRTKEGVLVQARFQAALDDECYRCLDPVVNQLTIELEELYTYHVAASLAEFSIDEDAILDLGPLVRAEVLIEKSHRTLCRPDCQGLCPQCGINKNHGLCRCDLDNVDPRLAELKKLLDLN